MYGFVACAIDSLNSATASNATKTLMYAIFIKHITIYGPLPASNLLTYVLSMWLTACWFQRVTLMGV